MEFHIARAVREELGLDEVLFSYTGNVVFANVAASRRLAQQLTAARVAKLGADAEPVNAGALYAMGLIDELSHAMIARYRRETDPAVLTEALRFLAQQSSAADVDKLLRAFTTQFPNTAIFTGKLTVEKWLAATTEDLPNREAALEELLLLWLANINPAFLPFRELFGDAALRETTVYKQSTETLPAYFETRPPVDPEVGTLLDALRAPMLASPGSLGGQLDFMRERWAPLLGEELRHILLAIDVLREEDIAIWMRFHPPSPDKFLHGDPRFEAHGFHGDEYVGFEDEWIVGPDGVRTRRYATDHQAPLNEYEAFSADHAWMPNVVLIAKSTYVWLEQLSKKYQRHIHRLDHIPEEELEIMARRGITGLWLIGLWERSSASQTIKRLRGHGDAVASAYSLKEYCIAEDLGGNYAYEQLRDKAARFGVRLASDMVPNHMGIDSTWVIENPDWFLSRWEPPFPAYTFNGPDLSSDSRVEIKIEDHYYDQTDAAVAFRIRHHRDGATRYMYHGNDGTTFAWNDTAQLDYSKAAVREHVIQTILQVARLFPIIRFDAAMTLAKRHVQRLWFPLPGVGGSIPSRAEDAITQEQFDALMPHEFWREVVDRVAVEVPGTLLLAEAFWMLEGYFVRTLGMHRVYNSAFMNMLRDEENAKYRSYMKKTIEFDPDILKRYVNFMSNPDERTAIDQFGSGDKCFGVATLMCTLPGLPMFGHGQIEGYTERYGMEFKQAKMDEWPNEGLVERHQREIAPLLKNRWQFAESTHFALYDFWTNHGAVDENVFAYANRNGDARSLVVYNNSYNSTEGTLHHSAESMDKGSGTLRTRSLTDALGLTGDHDVVLAYRDHARELDYLMRASQLAHSGFHIALRGYQYAVLLHWRELRSTAEHPWDALCDALNGAGVHNLDAALAQLRLRPVHAALRDVVSAANIAAFHGDGVANDFAERAVAFYDAASQHLPPTQRDEDATKLIADILDPAQEYAKNAAALVPALAGLAASVASWKDATACAMLPGVVAAAQPERTWAPVLAWAALQAVPLPKDASRASAFDTLQLRASLAETFAGHGFEGEDAWRAAARVRLALATETSDGDAMRAVSEEAFWQDNDARWLGGVNESEGVTYIQGEQFHELLCWLALLALVHGEDPAAIRQKIEALQLQLAEAGYRLDGFLAPVKVAAPAKTSTPASAPKPEQKTTPAPAMPSSSGPTQAVASSTTPAPPDKLTDEPAADVEGPAAKTVPKKITKSATGKPRKKL
jgi:glycosidase